MISGQDLTAKASKILNPEAKAVALCNRAALLPSKPDQIGSSPRFCCISATFALILCELHNEDSSTPPRVQTLRPGRVSLPG